MDFEMDDHGFATITVSLADRPDGGVSVSCSDLPGLILSGRDKSAVIKSIPAAIRMLLEDSGLTDVVVNHTIPVAELLKRTLPADVDVHVQNGLASDHVHHFVVEYRRAA